MRRLLVLALLVAGCGGGGAAAPEAVVRSWSEAVNAGEYERAARLFADDAEVVQGDAVLRFDTRERARSWNASLPCTGTIEALETEGELARASFRLASGPGRACDAPGAVARVVVRVRDGKIVLWHQLDARTAPARPV